MQFTREEICKYRNPLCNPAYRRQVCYSVISVLKKNKLSAPE